MTAPSTKDDFNDIRDDVKEAAEAKAKAEARKQNKHEWTCDLTVIGNLSVVESTTFNVEGYGVYDGKYIADKVTHTLDGQGGFTTEINGHRVLEGY